MSQLRPTDAERVAESLAAQLRGQGGEVAVAAVPAVRVLADRPRAEPQLPVARQACARDCEAEPFAVAVVHDAAAERVEFAVRGRGRCDAAGPRRARWPRRSPAG